KRRAERRTPNAASVPALWYRKQRTARRKASVAGLAERRVSAKRLVEVSKAQGTMDDIERRHRRERASKARSADRAVKDMVVAVDIDETAPSSISHDWTRESWIEQFLCAGDLACRGIGGRGIDYFGPTDEGEDEDGSSLLRNRDDAELSPPLPLEIDPHRVRSTSSQVSAFTISTEQGAPPRWTTEASSYDTAALLSLLEGRGGDRPGVNSVRGIRQLLEQDKWTSAFESMTPQEYAALVANLDAEFDRPEVAALVAPCVNGGDFTHEYVVAVLKAVGDWSRAPLIARLLPLCADLWEDGAKVKIEAELSEWNLACSRSVLFGDAPKIDWNVKSQPVS
ncbi:hypothetical protein ACHAWF_009238, partial [Thalassiosira exigua]